MKRVLIGTILASFVCVLSVASINHSPLGSYGVAIEEAISIEEVVDTEETVSEEALNMGEIGGTEESANVEKAAKVEETVDLPDGKDESIPECDGILIIKDCIFEGVVYSSYIYHPEVPEVYDYETVTTYNKEVVGYCTLCKDGTYSPTCATGRGACSHHGGVLQWNAPVYKTVPKQNQKKVLISSSKPAYYEKVVK
ncbi:MAG: hypothetical protein WBK67_03640 [Minisyncoccales bacterium]|jgi:hypothetical protein